MISLHETCDVLVVGAGPSGSSASLAASREGADILLIEKEKEIGVPVRCGEFFPSLEEAKSLLSMAKSTRDFIEEIYGLISDEAVSNRTKIIKIYSPRNRTYEFEFDGIVLRREIFEKNLVHKAQEAGVKLQTSSTTRAINKNNGFIKASIDSLSCKNFVSTKLIIGADGFPSNIGRLMHLRSHYKAEDIVLCAQYKMKNVKSDEDTVEIYFGKKYAPGGYAWIIPKGGNEANVGLGIRLPYLKRRMLITRLNTFIKKHEVASKHFSSARKTSLIVKMVPVGGLVENVCGNQTLLVGDAAGTVIPINGCGIPPALISGHIAGKIAAKHLRGESDLSAYVNDLNKEIGKVLERGLMYRKIADKFMYRDELFDMVLSIIGIENIAKIIKCQLLQPSLT